MPDTRPFFERAQELFPEFAAAPSVTRESPFLSALLDKQRLESAGTRERVQAAGESGLATAESRLAQRGGITTGARERLARDFRRTQLLGEQEQARADAISRLGLTAGAQQQEQARADAEAEARRAFELQRFQTQIAGMAGEEQARATEAAGEK